MEPIAFTSEAEQANWRALRLFSGYRIFLASVLFFVFYLQLSPEFFGQKYPTLYFNVSVIYLFSSVLLLLLTSQQWGDFQQLCMAQLLFDIVALFLVIHTSGGLQTGLGALLVVIVVAGGALVPGRLAALIAAVATLSVLFEASYAYFESSHANQLGQAGILGAIFFITALLAQLLSRVVQQSQNLAEQRRLDIYKLAMLNQHIISRMQVAVLVLDEQGKVTLLNASAQKLLALDSLQTGFKLIEKVPILAAQVSRWREYDMEAFVPFQISADSPELTARANRLDSGEVIIFFEDSTQLAQQAQQLKLASLGRLTASIAHEIRNPLSAISHAGELLAEQPENQKETTQKLTQIIQRHSARVNTIIETILQMSRRKNVEPSTIVLATWLEKFTEEFCEIKQLLKQHIKLEIHSPLARIWSDPQQLHQVMWNLLENALHYADLTAAAPITLRLDKNNETIMIDVIDNGPGVNETKQSHLFEPFYSERIGGTGLGLYLARELCQANGARLNYLHTPKPCFRISYPLEQQESLQ